MNDVFGWALFVAIALVGLASTVFASIWLWRLLRKHQVGAVPAAVIVGVAAVLIFWGLWIVFDVGWIVAAVVRLTMRLAGGDRRATQMNS